MITLHDLNSHADLVIQLNTARQMLAAFQSAVLRASSIDGMPHAPSVGNSKVEALAIKLSDLEEDVKRREAAVKRSEPEIKSFIAGIQDPRLPELVEKKIAATIYAMGEMVHGFDFARLLTLYYEAYKMGDDAGKGCVIKWFRGEYRTKTEARRELGVTSIIGDEDWYDYIISELLEDKELAAAVRRKDKSLIGCIGALLKWSYRNKYKVDDRIIKASGISASGVEMGIPGMATAKNLIRGYYGCAS